MFHSTAGTSARNCRRTDGATPLDFAVDCEQGEVEAVSLNVSRGESSSGFPVLLVTGVSRALGVHPNVALTIVIAGLFLLGLRVSLSCCHRPSSCICGGSGGGCGGGGGGSGGSAGGGGGGAVAGAGAVVMIHVL